MIRKVLVALAISVIALVAMPSATATHTTPPQKDQRLVRNTGCCGTVNTYTQMGPSWFNSCGVTVAGEYSGDWKYGLYWVDGITDDYVEFELVNYITYPELSSLWIFSQDQLRARLPYYKISAYWRPNSNYSWVHQDTFNVDPFHVLSDTSVYNYTLYSQPWGDC